MPRVTFMPSEKSIEVVDGTLLFDAALRAGLPVAASCSAFRVCGRCNMSILSGGDNLSAQSAWERKLLDRDKKPPDNRISCLTKVWGDCTVTTTYW